MFSVFIILILFLISYKYLNYHKKRRESDIDDKEYFIMMTYFNLARKNLKKCHCGNVFLSLNDSKECLQCEIITELNKKLMMKWISINQYLPVSYGHYLVWVSGYKYYPKIEFFSGKFSEDVTHWCTITHPK